VCFLLPDVLGRKRTTLETRDQHKALIKRYLNNLASSADIDLLLVYFDVASEEDLRSAIAGVLNRDDADDVVDAGLKGHVAGLYEGILAKIEEGEALAGGQVKQLRLWPGFRIKSGMASLIAAAAVAVIVFGIWFYSNELASSRRASRSEVTQNDIAPGKHTAMLTLASGRKINLSDAKTGVLLNTSRFSYDDGSAIEDPVATDGNAVNSKTGRWNEVSTPKGGTYKVTLPDGTNVWLNAASTLRFPNRFIVGRRYVQLTGEAYFEVAKDRAHPFIVSSNRQQIEVLGTHFNVSNYPDEKTATTTLLEGSITINNVLLKPNQEAVLMGLGGLVISNVEASDAMAWKDGKFRFNNTDLEVVLRQLGRWYDVDIRYIGEIPDRKFTGGIDRNINASEALDILKYLKVNFKIEGKTIIVSK
jgi:hypothetical protein